MTERELTRMNYIGFDIGGTKCAVSVASVSDGNIHILDKRKIPTDHTIGAYGMLDRLIALCEEMTGVSGRIFGESYPYVGVSCGGPLSEKEGIVLSPPNLPGWDEIRLTEYLEKHWGNRAYLINDANACALAEHRFGAGRGTSHMIFLTFGTGLGGGLILNGELYSGASDMAGEAGHLRLRPSGPVGYGKAGSFEGFCSGGGIAKLGMEAAARLFSEGKPCSFAEGPEEISGITAKKIADCAEAGFEDAKEIYRLSGERLGEGLSILIDLLNPERIVIGSVYQRSGHLLREAMEEVLKRECLPQSLNACEIVPAELSESLGDYAAVSAAMLCEERKGRRENLT